MSNIQKSVFIYFFIAKFYITTWNGGWMVKVSGCGQRYEGSNPTLNILWSWYDHDNMP
jgi:hypothetical protein